MTKDPTISTANSAVYFPNDGAQIKIKLELYIATDTPVIPCRHHDQRLQISPFFDFVSFASLNVERASSTS